MAVDPIPFQHPLLRCAAVVSAAVALVEDSDPAFMRLEDKQRALRAFSVLVDQLVGIQGRLLSAGADVAEQIGDRSVGAWLARETHGSPREARRTEKLAAALARRPRIEQAVIAGEVSLAQARVMTAALDKLPTELGPELAAKAEIHLVGQAAHFGPVELERLGSRLLDVVAPEIAEEALARRLEAEERAAERQTRLTMHQREDGTTDIRIRVPQQAASRLKVYLDAFTSPRRREQSFGDPGPGPDDEVDRKPYAQRMGEAFCALLERMSSKALPRHGGTATTVMVTLSLGQLISGLGAADLLTGEQMSVDQVRRLSCTAGIVPVVLGGKGEILDHGRQRRLFSPAQQQAMALRDRHCRAEGCDLPAAWCEAHHVEMPWTLGGRTDLADGALLCSRHHHRAHDPGFRTTRMANGDLRFTRRT